MLINVKMPTNDDILTFTSMINAPSESLKAIKVFIFQHSVEISCSFELCMKKVYNLETKSILQILIYVI